MDTKACNMSPTVWHILLIPFYFLFSKVLFIDPSKACLGDLVAKDGSPRMGNKHTRSQMGKNSMWSLFRYCSFLGNEFTSRLYSLSPVPILSPFHFLPPSSSPFFIRSALSVLEVESRTLFVLGKLFYHWDADLVHFSLNTASWAFAYTITPKPLLIKISAPTFTSLKLVIYPILLLDTYPPSAPMKSCDLLFQPPPSLSSICVLELEFFWGHQPAPK